ncbi:hypothetical protein JCM5353_001558 [Sporobolomyces roseus]
MGVFKASSVKMRTCCFCISARLGTLMLSTLSILISATLAMQATMALFQDNFVSGFLVWVCLLECVIWWCLVNVCVYGWLGAVKKHYDWVEWYYELLWWHLWVNVVLGTYGIVVFSLPAAKDYRAAVCTAMAFVKLAEELPPNHVVTADQSANLALSCISAVKKHLLLIDFAYVIGILIQLYLVLVVAHYLDELADIEAAEKYGVDIESPLPPYDPAMIRGGKKSSSRGKA